MSELDWIRLAAAEQAGQADPDSTKNEERIYRDAYRTADRRGGMDRLGQELAAVRQEAIELAKAAAGKEALAAHARFEAVVSGREGLLADPADAPAVERYLGFADAASNAASAAAIRPYISRRDFAYLWRGYATVLDFTAKGAVESNATDADRILFGPGEVASILLYLDRLSPETWWVLVEAHQSLVRAGSGARMRRLLALVEEGGQRGQVKGAITTEDVKSVKQLAEAAADKALPAFVDRLASGIGKLRDVIEAQFGPRLASRRQHVGDHRPRASVPR